MKNSAPDTIIRPGAKSWEVWRFSAKGPPVCEENPAPKSLPSPARVILALPARDLLAVPLWVSAQGDPVELAELELSSRHLLRRNSAVYAIPVRTEADRALVLALASSDEGLAIRFVPSARTFEASARLWNPAGADAILWRELGELCFAFFHGDRCTFFSGTGETSPGPAFCGAMTRAALRLKAEGVLPRTPASLRVYGDFPRDELEALAGSLRIDIAHVSPPTPPILPADPSNPRPPAAKAAEVRRTGRKRLSRIASVAGVIYLAVAGFLIGDLVIRSMQLQKLRREVAGLSTSAGDAQRVVTDWREFRQAVDPRSFALDQLAAVAREIPGDQVRLTQFALENGRLTVSGEAADVAQAYALFEKIKASPSLQDYDWTSRQPQLAGKSKVRFEMEGVRPDAKTDSQ